MLFLELKERLQNLTKDRVTQADIARILNVSTAAMGNRVKRDSEFKLSEIEKIQEYYNVSLVGGSDDDCVLIEKIGINPSCGTGTSVYNDADITPVKLGKALIQEILNVSHPQNLKIFVASGDSMSPTIEDKDKLLVDIGRVDYANGGIFLLTVNNEWFIKRLNLRFSGELEIISDNLKYDKQVLTPDTQKEIIIKGRIIKNLSRGL